MTSSRTTAWPACAQRKVNARPAGPAPMTAMFMLLAGEGGDDVVVVGLGVLDVLEDAVAVFLGEAGERGDDAAQRDRDIVNVVHGANGFSGQGHGVLLWFVLSVAGG